MKILKSAPISAFGGLNYVIEEAINLNINKILDANLPKLPKQAKYNWFDLIMSYWSVFFCGGDCAEDLAINLREGLKKNPLIQIPSPDRILSRIKNLADTPNVFVSKRGRKEHQFSLAKNINRLNLKLLPLLSTFEKDNVVLDYDNTIIFSEKADARNTYQKGHGYCPGVGIIGKHIVYVENRNGNSNAQTLQNETIDRMSDLLKEAGITVDAIRADSASYTYDTIKSMEKASNRLFVKARMTESLETVISGIKEWKEVKVGNETLLRGSTTFTPFLRYARGNNKKLASLREYRLVVTKEARRDGQTNIFTGEAYNYSPIMTNDFDMTDDEVVFFYNARGAKEREFDVLKNDFGWNNMPFSKIEQNSAFLLIMAMCKNLYTHIIAKFSSSVGFLSPEFRVKKFIFRFICTPGKWVKSGRVMKLRLYGAIAFKT